MVAWWRGGAVVVVPPPSTSSPLPSSLLSLPSSLSPSLLACEEPKPPPAGMVSSTVSPSTDVTRTGMGKSVASQRRSVYSPGHTHWLLVV